VSLMSEHFSFEFFKIKFKKKKNIGRRKIERLNSTGIIRRLAGGQIDWLPSKKCK
jgi:hypothetical protein